MSGINEWLCGGCGQMHGWFCRYTGEPGGGWSAKQKAEGRKRLERDRRDKPWLWDSAKANFQFKPFATPSQHEED